MSVKDELLKEIETLSESQQAQILAYVRFIRLGLGQPQSIKERFDKAVAEIRQDAAGRGLSEAEIEAETKSVRSK